MLEEAGSLWIWLTPTLLPSVCTAAAQHPVAFMLAFAARGTRPDL